MESAQALGGATRVMLDRYEVLSKLGKGSFGSVYLVRSPAGNYYALKRVNLNSMSAEGRVRALQEVSLLQKLRHPFIVAYHDAFSTGGKLHLVMERATGGDLRARLKKLRAAPLPEAVVLRWLQQLALALAFVHSQNILHRDIKTENIFLDGSDTVKLGDFGISRVLENPQAYAETLVGTPTYLSPELCAGQPYSFKSDVWALGCVLFEMLTFRVPFQASTMAQLVACIARGVPVCPIPALYSTTLSALVKQLLTVSVTNRADMDFVLASPALQNIKLPNHIRPTSTNKAAAPVVQSSVTFEPAANFEQPRNPSFSALEAQRAALELCLPSAAHLRRAMDALPDIIADDLEARSPTSLASQHLVAILGPKCSQYATQIVALRAQEQRMFRD